MSALLPKPVADLLTMLARPGYQSQNGFGVETFTTPAACLGCGGDVAYPFDGSGLWDRAYCRQCCRMVLPVTTLGGYRIRWEPEA